MSDVLSVRRGCSLDARSRSPVPQCPDAPSRRVPINLPLGVPRSGASVRSGPQLCGAGTSAPRYGTLDAIAWHRGNVKGGRREPVGTKVANALGFRDMIGNAWEWVSGWYADYTRQLRTDRAGPATGTSKVARGSFFDYGAAFCRASQRCDINSPDFGDGIGFRVARTP